ncbi:MAG: Spy/CpxP family protein refolding chaperone [Candidatus Cloacimonadaceae bacterium]|nr:Spy/CpxP family protein refolding chaperone [Candidatus Cloacimonadaceae bacterium]
MRKIALITIAIMLFSTLLLAKSKGDQKQNPKRMKHDKEAISDQKHPGEMMEKLNLTTEQKKKFETMRTEHQKQMNTLKSEMENLKIDLQASVRNENYRRAKELNKQIATKQNQLKDAMIDHLEAMMKELTADQKVIAKEIFPRMAMGMDRMHQGQGRMGKRQGGMKHCN